MAVLPIILLGVAASIAGAQGKEVTPLEYGMNKGNEAYGYVCWYEYLRTFPYTSGKSFLKCQPGLKVAIKNVEMNKDYYKMYPEQEEAAFGQHASPHMNKLPSEYGTNCQKYLDDPKAAPSADESDTVNDQGNDYPYKAWVYCMMKTLRDKHGDKAIQAVKDEKTHGGKNWMQALLDRDNEFRARHGADPLTPITQLVEDAQAWADQNAQTCNSHHTENSERLLNGEQQGESIYTGGGEDEDDIAAYQASAGWYEEIYNYPFPNEYNGSNANGTVGHFTQTVWKETKHVGYGYAYNPNCNPYKKYIVARYHPAGNMQGAYGKNVDPPKDQ